jgi:hypothetical protein
VTVQAPVPLVEKSPGVASGGESFPPVFIVGCPRSGTTLLRMMLASHPELSIPPESHFIPKVWTVRRRYEQGGALRVERLARDIMRNDRYREWQLPEEEVWTRLRSLSNPKFADVIEAFFIAYAAREGKRRWGDKTPGYSLEMVLITKLFPTARFVHLIRDGRDVATSFRDNFEEIRWTDAAMVWATRVRKGRAQGRAVGPERYLEVRYEDLVDDPPSVLTSICDFIDLPYVPEMLEYSSNFSQAVPQREQHQIHKGLLQPPTKGLRDWRREMSSAELSLFEALAGRELDRLGYERALPNLPPTVRGRAVAARAANGGRQLAWKARTTAIATLKRDGLPPSRRW